MMDDERFTRPDPSEFQFQSRGPVVLELTPRTPFVAGSGEVPGGGLEAQRPEVASASADVYAWLASETEPLGGRLRVLIDFDHLTVGATYLVELAVGSVNFPVPADATYRVTTRPGQVAHIPFERERQVVSVLMEPDQEGRSLATVAAINVGAWLFFTCRLSRVVDQ